MDQRPRQVETVVINRRFWDGRRVFITGHTGFKGGWMTLLLASLGAKLSGFALAPESDRGVFNAARLAGDDLDHRIGDIRDFARLKEAVSEARPDVVIHMAAQSLVRLSYREPVETYATNVMGTVHLLEAAREVPGIEAVLIVTSDKCYENVGRDWSFRENDPLGGHDPYSSSKGCAELVTSAYRRSFFNAEDSPRVASARAGNVIGGGDWALDRLVPDAIRAFSAGEPLIIRNPAAVRPWQHVLDPLLGYLKLAEHLVQGGMPFAEAWNFGPSAASEVPVEMVAGGLQRRWGNAARWDHEAGHHPHEAAYLRLDCAKAQGRLSWRPLIGLDQALDLTVDWYKEQLQGADMRAISLRQIELVLRPFCGI
jgi:CDP-glucose 4,6-dehydratase